MTVRSPSAKATRALFIGMCGASLSVSASAAVPPDSIYFHCDNAGGDFRISELNHSVSQYSERFQEYRILCSECDITEWGNKITMKDGTKTFIQVNRMTGFVLIQRSNAASLPGSSDIYSFQGTCKRAPMRVALTPKRVAGRAF
ncbi:hypothetical protein BH09PSE4_BH09PSE4_15410 [soil metagenome]